MNQGRYSVEVLIDVLFEPKHILCFTIFNKLIFFCYKKNGMKNLCERFANMLVLKS